MTQGVQASLQRSDAGGSGSDALGALGWGHDSDTAAGWTFAALRRRAGDGDALGRALRELVAWASERLTHVTAPPPRRLQMMRGGDAPRSAEQNAHGHSLQLAWAWAFAGRLDDGPRAATFLRRARGTAMAWVDTCVPSGHPIEESRLDVLLQALDLLAPIMPAAERQRALAWSRDLALRSEGFYAALVRSHRQFNNWGSWHLLISGMAATLAQDAGLLATHRARVLELVSRNIGSDGATVDFHARDALHYQVYDLRALVQLALFVPRAVTAESCAALERGLQFLEPYWSGRAAHVEFARSHHAADAARPREPWKPAQARALLKLARARFPSLREWSAGVEQERDLPRLELLAALNHV